jgi:hypothetical protein
MRREPWVPPGIIVQARDGRVVLWGLVANAAEEAALKGLAGDLPECRGVESHLVVRSELPHAYRYGV